MSRACVGRHFAAKALRSSLQRMSNTLPFRCSRFDHAAPSYASPRALVGRSQGGFTIIELMISTLIFSLVMLVITVGVLDFSKAYYKGVTASRTQNVARSTIEDISQAVQFSGQAVVPTGALPAAKDGSQGFCIGNERYSYLPHYQLEEGKHDASAMQNQDVLMRDTVASCTQPQALLNQTSNGGACGSGLCGTELLSPHMRVAHIQLKPLSNPNLYSISIRIVYGDADLINDPKSDNMSCKYGVAGTQFCAVSQLTTVVEKRLGARSHVAPAPNPASDPNASANIGSISGCGASLSCVPANGAYHYDSYLINHSQNPASDIAGCQWDFGDGVKVNNQSCQTGQSITHVYARLNPEAPYPRDCFKRAYTATLTVNLKNGATAKDSYTSSLPYCY